MRARQRHHDRRRAHVVASSMIRRPAWPERTRSTWPDTRAPACTPRLLDQRLGGRDRLRHRRVDLQRARHGDDREHVDPAAAARRELGRGGDHGLVVAVAQRDEHRVVLGLVIDDRLRDRDLVRGGQIQALRAPVEAGRRTRRASASTTPVIATSGCSAIVTTSAANVPNPPRKANTGRSWPRKLPVARRAVGPVQVGLGDPQPDDRRVRDRERQHRAERVQVAEERGLARERDQDRERSRRRGCRSTACGTSGAAGAADRAAGGGCPSSTRAARRRSGPRWWPGTGSWRRGCRRRSPPGVWNAPRLRFATTPAIGSPA